MGCVVLDRKINSPTLSIMHLWCLVMFLLIVTFYKNLTCANQIVCLVTCLFCFVVNSKSHPFVYYKIANLDFSLFRLFLFQSIIQALIMYTECSDSTDAFVFLFQDAAVQPSLVIVYFGGNDSMGPHSSGLGPHVPLPEYIDNMRKIASHVKVLFLTIKIIQCFR